MEFTIKAQVSENDKHLSEVTCLLLHNNYLYSGADDGKIKVWTIDLILVKEINAHPVNVYSLAASDDDIYSCSNDGTIKAWGIGSWQLKKTLIESPNDEVLQLTYKKGKLYSGDDKGNIYVWENYQPVGKYEVAEEIWGLMIHGTLLFSARNLDVSIIDMKPGGKHYTFIHSISGRSPLIKVGNYFCFLDREGKRINVHQLEKETNFKSVGTLEGHEMMINSISSTSNPQLTVFSGGYDKTLKRWDVLTQECLNSIAVDTVINTLAALSSATVYVGGSMGYITKMDIV